MNRNDPARVALLLRLLSQREAWTISQLHRASGISLTTLDRVLGALYLRGKIYHPKHQHWGLVTNHKEAR